MIFLYVACIETWILKAVRQLLIKQKGTIQKEVDDNSRYNSIIEKRKYFLL